MFNTKVKDPYGHDIDVKDIPEPEDFGYLGTELNQSNPLPWQSYVNSGVTDTAMDILGRVNNKSYAPTPADAPHGKQLTPDQKAGLLNPEEPKQAPGDYYQNTFARGVNLNGPPHPTNAIDAKYANQIAPSYQGLRNQLDTGNPIWKSGQLSRASDALGNVYKNQIQNFQEQMNFQLQRQQMYNQWKNAQESSKASFLGTLLGLAGGAAGLLFGGPAGAAAGAAAGSAAGSKI